MVHLQQDVTHTSFADSMLTLADTDRWKAGQLDHNTTTTNTSIIKPL